MLRSVCYSSTRAIFRTPTTRVPHLRTLASISPATRSSFSRQLSTSHRILSNMAPSDNTKAKRPRESNEKDEHDQEHENKDDWKKQPPYAPEDPNKHKDAKFKGNCHCHDVTFEIYVDKPKGSHFCQ